MSLFSLMRLFTIRFRMLSAIAVVLGLLGMLGGAGMFGMFRIQSMSGDFVAHEFAEVKELGELRGALGAIRLHEKDMIIQQGNADAVKQAHTRWLASLEEAKKVANQFTQGAEDKDNAVARSLVQRLDSYREQFAGVARQLEAGGGTWPPWPAVTVARRWPRWKRLTSCCRSWGPFCRTRSGHR